MLKSLWGGLEATTEQQELFLCRDVYHCPPDVLDRQNWERIVPHLVILELESQVRAARSAMKK